MQAVVYLGFGGSFYIVDPQLERIGGGYGDFALAIAISGDVERQQLKRFSLRWFLQEEEAVRIGYHLRSKAFLNRKRKGRREQHLIRIGYVV